MALRYIINHVFLPPKLPQAADRGHLHDHSLIETVRDAAILFSKEVLLDSSQKDGWGIVSQMLDSMATVHRKTYLEYTGLLEAFQKMSPGGKVFCKPSSAITSPNPIQMCFLSFL